MADDGHTINVGPVTVGEALPKAIVVVDLDAIERDVWARRIVGDPLADTLAALVAAVRWAQDAPHRPGCPARWNGIDPAADNTPRRPCTCGRDEALAPFEEGDRG